MAPSYASGIGSKPLLGETIGAHLERIARELPDHPALVSRHQGPASPTRSSTRRSTGSRARSSPRGSRPATASASGARTAPSGRSSSTRRRRRGSSSSTSTRPTGPSELAYVLNQSGCRLLVARDGVQDLATTSRWSTRSRGDCPTLERVVFLGRATGTSCIAGRRAAERRGAARAPGRDCSSTTRSTSSTRAAPRASPRARRSATTTSSTTATSSASGCRYTEARPRLHPGALLPLLRHGHGQPRLHHARRAAWSSRRRPSTRRDARRRSRTSAARRSTACRRCSSPSSSTPSSPSST